jgi:hypothetical protein
MPREARTMMAGFEVMKSKGKYIKMPATWWANASRREVLNRGRAFAYILFD